LNRLTFGSFNGVTLASMDLDSFSVAHIIDRPEDVIVRHTHDGAHFQFQIQGTYITTARHIEGICGPGATMFNPAGTTHRDRFKTRGGSFLTLSVKPTVIERLGGHAILHESAVGFVTGDPCWLGARLYSEVRQGDDASALAIEGIGFELLAAIVRRGTSSPEGAPRMLDQAFSLINDCYREKLTLSKVAAAVNARPLELARAFRSRFRCSMAQLLRRTRIAHARDLLAGRSLTLSEIALACGFSDQPQFTKAFKRATGLTPAQYRQWFRVT
jgi:AraC family transcriptional regulator